ncbi:class I SAM-dependent methyltransferase [Radiobacillus kanasensis]|uniref:class I SAM-dependent methyltransferase n=1 Tax=Radiobacillus kanasensis TaxID=2844358 RepID=UPI001E41FD2A|nr:class I SAM-dependent methyltransferase [Radiobacillus kanasensis]UFU00845.1 class I SAM-dependent methyltransferase [Radiobacillus kanasensis]
MIKSIPFSFYVEEFNQPFSGWDFSYISETGRVQTELLPWSYGSIVLPYMQQATSMLDMGTGGGELLSSLRPFPAQIYATEGYEPNVPIAKNRLEPLGVKVYAIQDDDTLPFESNLFDFITNKHESYSVPELKRILRPKGIFVTQQVGGLDCNDINTCLGAPINPEYSHWNLDYAINELENAGFEIVHKSEYFPKQRFYDIGALLYYLKAIPWQIPGFKIKDYEEKLSRVHDQIQQDGYLDIQQHRFMLIAIAK